MPDEEVYLFGPFRLDVDGRELYRQNSPGGAQQAIHLRPQVFDFLVYLVRNRDRAVEKQELFHALPKHPTSGQMDYDANLVDRALYDLRTKLGDSAAAPLYVKPRGLGRLRFVHPVSFEAHGSAASDRPSPSAGRPNIEAATFDDIVYRKYLDANFTSTPPPVMNVGGTDVEMSLRHLKHLSSSVPSELWRLESQKLGTWHNKVAYQLSILLQRLGFAVFRGAVSARDVLTVAGDQILDDWFLCKDWVDFYRAEQQRVTMFGTVEIHYHRRHGEWLALLAGLWQLHRQLAPADTRAYKQAMTPDAIDRLTALSQYELSDMHADTRAFVEGLLQRPL